MNSDSSRRAPSAAREPICVRRAAGAGSMIRRILSVCLFIGVLLACVPLMPTFPEPRLGAAWGYAMNEAVARRIVFGRDIIFTCGPYAFAYTGQYHPATDCLMLIADALIGVAIAMGGLSLASGRRIAYLLPLPAVIALPQRPDAVLSDSLFFILPLIFLVVSVRITLPAAHKWKLAGDWRVALSLAFMALALNLLPLVKVTFGAMSASIGSLGWLLLLRWRARWALVLGAVFVVGLLGFWLAADQPLWALPGFFVAEMPTVSGYGDAMSLTGTPADLIWYLINASCFCLLGFAFSRAAPDSPVRRCVWDLCSRSSSCLRRHSFDTVFKH